MSVPFDYEITQCDAQMPLYGDLSATDLRVCDRWSQEEPPAI